MRTTAPTPARSEGRSGPGPCRSCSADLDHCHGLLLTHHDGTTECLGEGPCLVDAHGHGHDWRLSCADLGERCECELVAAA